MPGGQHRNHNQKQSGRPAGKYGRPRIGDHICYISDLRKIRAHFPNWRLTYDLSRLLDEIVARYARPGHNLLEKLPA